MANELAPLSQDELRLVNDGLLSVSDLVWYSKSDGEVRVSQMTDMHIKNAALKLIGFSEQRYEADIEHQARWLFALKVEWEKRMENRRAKKVD